LYTLGRIAVCEREEKEHAEEREKKRKKKMGAKNIDSSSREQKKKKKRSQNDHEVRWHYHTEGMANAYILALSGCTSGPLSVRIDKPGEESYDAICAERSTMPCGVGGDAEDAGDVDVEELHDDGVSGVAGGVPYEEEVVEEGAAGGADKEGFGGEG
jgi:hypothetical protein